MQIEANFNAMLRATYFQFHARRFASAYVPKLFKGTHSSKQLQIAASVREGETAPRLACHVHKPQGYWCALCLLATRCLEHPPDVSQRCSRHWPAVSSRIAASKTGVRCTSSTCRWTCRVCMRACCGSQCATRTPSHRCKRRSSARQASFARASTHTLTGASLSASNLSPGPRRCRWTARHKRH